MREVDTFLGTQPIMLNAVGGGLPARWQYKLNGNWLEAYCFTGGVDAMFNLKSPADIERKMTQLKQYRDLGLIDDEDLRELAERLRTYSSLSLNGNEEQSMVAVEESKAHKKGKKYFTYDMDGTKKEHIGRGKRKIVTSKQKTASRKNLEKANTPQAIAKRIRSRKRNKGFRQIDDLSK